MWFFCIFLVLQFNFTIMDSKTNGMLVYFNLIIRKYLNSFSMIFVAYYFFSKAVQGYKEKVLWKVIMKALLMLGIVIDIALVFYFFKNYYSNTNVDEFKPYISLWGKIPAMRYSVCSDPAWFVFEIYFMFFFFIFIIFILKMRKQHN